jgi:hypothetical protein
VREQRFCAVLAVYLQHGAGAVGQARNLRGAKSTESRP